MPCQPSKPAAEAAPVRIRRLGEYATAPANLDALLSRLYAHRGDARPAVSLGELLPAAELRGIDAAAALLADQIQRGGRLLIVGDYDADGATGSAVALLGLRALGAVDVDHLTPSRFQHGYGLSPAVVDAAVERRPSLIVTVDNGIASHAGVARATELGIPVLITDHHLAGAELPSAAAIVNPNQPGCGFPSKHIAGCGVVFYLLAATRAELTRRGWFAALGAAAGRPPPNLAQLLDLVALGTVADVVTLDRNNRILVEQGLRRIRAGACRPGLKALLEVAGCRVEGVTARDLGFVAGPRLNAAGRLDDMAVGVECLTTDDPVRAMRLAQQLHGLNDERREIERDILDQAIALVERQAVGRGGLGGWLCVYGAHWHEGVIGIVAARLRERWHRPAIVFADGGDGLLRGSARSIEALHIRDAIDAVHKRHPELIERFGGHAMAAGLSLRRDALGDFRDAFDAEIERQLGTAPAVREILSDGELPPSLLTLHTADALRRAGPWGKGFAEPLFDGVFAVGHSSIAAERHLKLRVSVDGAAPLPAIGFHLAEHRGSLGERVRLAYRLDINDYRGLRSPQLVFEHLEPVSD
ncbi:MAG: single-stranded-DNA-specific exonuclease RecJ [Thiohalocapsa sp.]|jgi:single-stranded-DNA-specific exonuclease|uniref:single-stranded-DNA-specific exonuclease RecJ n=1 Tax=Thiohalocapsa sp. TaxID=2497641 RepID=UPI0025D91C59|nr:single-stranded-DNA-specific exonuclease RecJ [Thiohalocapsa sp.]MCG6940267.1 single-stranded-DNA-specific exonuclease RecJ [Thiohalocapsa sp.]